MTRTLSATLDVSERMAWMLAALLPVVGVTAIERGAGWLGGLALGILVAVMPGLLSNRPGQSLQGALPWHLDAAVVAMLVSLLMPKGSGLLPSIAAIVLAVVVGRMAFGGLGQSLFHPAMVGLAVAGSLWTPPNIPEAGSPWSAIACLLGAVALSWRRVNPWRAPIAFLCGALLAASVLRTEASLSMRVTALLQDPSTLLCAFFVAGDSATGCLRDRARLAFGLGAGVLAVAFTRWQPGHGLPLAILLMNFLAPWIEQATSASRREAFAQ